MKIVTFALIAAVALTGPALARDKNAGVSGRSRAAQSTQYEAPYGEKAPMSEQETYAWPDQRYYGAHGMLSD